MKVARYVGGGRIEICDEPEPQRLSGGLIVQSEASSLCSGELMDWYMDRKIPHVLGHEVAGKVIWSDDTRFPVGCRVAPHHHAPCMECPACQAGLHVHCEQWKSTRLIPGGLAERFAVANENLSDTHRVDDLRPEDAALMEPLACVVKSVLRARIESGQRVAVIGLGSMGIAHLLALGNGAEGYEMNASRRAWARNQGLSTRVPDDPAPADVAFVCPGTLEALSFAVKIIEPGGTIVLFAPFPPDAEPHTPLNRLYFSDVSLVTTYSCGPNDTAQALKWLRGGKIRAEQLVSDFIGMDELPRAYDAMKAGDILKPMVLFS